MKRDYLLLIKSLIGVIGCFCAFACDKSSVEVPYFEMRPVSKYQRDSLTLTMSYHNTKINSNVAEYNRYIYNNLVSKAVVVYKGDNIQCAIDSITYTIQWDRIRGGVRLSELNATIQGAQYFNTTYLYDEEGRMISAMINITGGPYFTNFTYDNSSIEIYIYGPNYEKHVIDLSVEENTGYVCNVLGYPDSQFFNRYVIIPELYFLNIFGAPVNRLPVGHPITRTSNSLRVGNHYYEFP